MQETKEKLKNDKIEKDNKKKNNVNTNKSKKEILENWKNMMNYGKKDIKTNYTNEDQNNFEINFDTKESNKKIDPKMLLLERLATGVKPSVEFIIWIILKKKNS